MGEPCETPTSPRPPWVRDLCRTMRRLAPGLCRPPIIPIHLYERRSSFSQATVKISFVVSKLYTRKQGQYLAFIYYYTKLNGRAPSEHQMVLTLAANGLVERVPKVGRSLRLLVPRAELPDLE